MKAVDDAFKTRLHYEDALRQVFIDMYTGAISSKNLTTDESKKNLLDIENGLVHRLQFAVCQRRLVTYLENQGILANSAMAWKDATFELNVVSKILWVWNTKRISTLSIAVLTELNCGMTQDNFDWCARLTLTENCHDSDPSHHCTIAFQAFMTSLSIQRGGFFFRIDAAARYS
jgi:hypothetical protein